jgi:hypothetical protein
MQPQDAVARDKNNQFLLDDDEKERLLNDDIIAVKTTNPNSNEASDKISGSPNTSDTNEELERQKAKKNYRAG